MTSDPKRLPKAPTGIEGFDQITDGGLPRGRPSLVCGAAGCGKTLFALEFLVHGAVRYGEPGVFVTFEESADELIANVTSLGFDLPALIKGQKLAIDHVHINRRETHEAGEYDLDGLFLRIGYAVDTIGAKRIVLDTIEVLFSAFLDEARIRAEIQRLFHWLKEKNLTAVITAERGQGALTRQGLEEYVSDCVILLDHRLENQVSTRRLRVVKYRGSAHGTNEYPFLIGENGFSVLPITALSLDHPVSPDRVSTGVPRLDAMLGGGGVYRGSSLLITGTAGAGKTSLAAHAADACVKRGERCIYFAFEESPAQIKRNMRSIGIDLERGTESGLLCFRASRPTLHGLEMHLATMYAEISAFNPSLVIVDPVTNLTSAGSDAELNAMLMRLIDFLKARQVTALFTSLTSGGEALEQTAVGVSSLMDTWLLVRIIDVGGERNRGLYILKARGMAHSNQVREFVMTNHGVELLDVYVGPHGVLTGSARYAQEAKERAEELARQQEFEARRSLLDRRRAAVEAQIAALRAELDSEEYDLQSLLVQKNLRDTAIVKDRQAMAKLRKADSSEDHPNDSPAAGETAGKGAPQW